MSQIHKLNDYKVKNAERLFFDTNVWVFCASRADKERQYLVEIYTDFLKRIKGAGGKIFTSDTVISEYVNVVFNHELRVYKRKNFMSAPQEAGLSAPKEETKKFRRSGDFREIGEKITTEVKTIIRLSDEIMHNPLSKSDLHAMLEIFKRGACEFNDLMIEALCNKHNLILVTHDSDFAERCVPIITANYKMMK